MLVFLKLGGSLITDKFTPEAAQIETIKRAAAEIRQALNAQPDLKLLIGHGSGSFGHVAAKKYGTRQGVPNAEAWLGFAEVGLTAARLNTIMVEGLQEAGVPLFRVQPSASARCEGGKLIEMATYPLQAALANGLVPLVYGDVAFDAAIGGTIISTEDIFDYLARILKPAHILLAGEFPGVLANLDDPSSVVPHLTAPAFEAIKGAVGGAKAADVTGGMAAKVQSMLALCGAVPGLSVTIFSGAVPGNIYNALMRHQISGTQLTNV